MTPESQFLEWVKNLEDQLKEYGDQRSQWYDLSGSAVATPDRILEQDMRLASQWQKPDQWGNPELKRMIAGLSGVNESRVFLTPGASSALYFACRLAIGEGRNTTAIVEHPCYQPLELAVREAGASNVAHVERSLWRAGAGDGFERQTKDGQLLLMSNPHNPTSDFLNENALGRLHELAKEREQWVVVDEVFRGVGYDPGRSAASMGEQFIVVGGLSKVYGLSPLRCGWLIPPEKLQKEAKRLYLVLFNIGSSILEAIACSVLKRRDQYDTYVRNHLSLSPYSTASMRSVSFCAAAATI